MSTLPLEAQAPPVRPAAGSADAPAPATSVAAAPGPRPTRGRASGHALTQAVLAARSEWLLLGVGVLAAMIWSEDLGFLANIAATAVFALSLSLVLGQAGIASIGHAAMLGCGAYAAGLFALHASSDPLLGLAVGAVAGGAIAALSGALLLRARGLTMVMLTIATSQILLELFNWARGVTGGDDGLTGFTVAPLLGAFEFDFMGRTGYWYALGVLIAAFWFLRRLTTSPFGLTTRAIRLDPGRVEALGGRVYLHLMIVYTVGGCLAGVAGALTAQITKVASLNMLDYQTSAGVLIMVVLGGTRRLSGAVIGAIVYMVIQHVAAALNPQHWLLAIGLMLIATLVFLPEGLIELYDRAVRRLRRHRVVEKERTHA